MMRCIELNVSKMCDQKNAGLRKGRWEQMICGTNKDKEKEN
jgi:hypothetical protein